MIPVSQLAPVPDRVPLEAAAVASCGVVTGLGAVLNIAKPDPGSSALVLGCGGVGLSIIQGCRLAGVTKSWRWTRCRLVCDWPSRWGRRKWWMPRKRMLRPRCAGLSLAVLIQPLKLPEKRIS